jgi:hypothetical protein
MSTVVATYATLIICVLIMIIVSTSLVVILTRKPPKRDGDDTAFLFSITSGDEQPSATVERVDNYTFTVQVSTLLSTFIAFTDIPKHLVYELGNMKAAEILFTRSKTNVVALEELSEAATAFIGTFALDETPFIDKEPNCTLSFTQVVSTQVSHVENIAKMVKIEHVFGTDSSFTKMTFKTLPNLRPTKLIPSGVYEHVSITVDDLAPERTVGRPVFKPPPKPSCSIL